MGLFKCVGMCMPVFCARTYVYTYVYVTVCSNTGIACRFAPDQGDHKTRTVTWT
jgi:hypothetical protein